MKGVRPLLLVVPMLLLVSGCPSSDDDGGGIQDVGRDRGLDRSLDPGFEPVVDPAADPVADPVSDPVREPRPDVASDQIPDPVTDPVQEPGQDVTVDTPTDPTGGDFDQCIPGFLVGGVSEAYGGTAEGESAIFYFWDDSDTEPTMELSIEIYTEYGAPTGPGTYPIDATEADYATCGLCIMALTETEAYMPVANSGSITITQMTMGESIVGSTFSGSLDLTMQEVDIDPGTYETTPVPGGCTGDLEHTFSETVQAIPE